VVDIAKLGLEIDSKQVKTATSDLSRFQNQADKVGKTAQRLGRNMSLYVTTPILGAGAMAVKTASEYERLQTQLEVLVGSAEKAEQVFGRLTEFASTTPFELEGITSANNMLLGFGLSVERTFGLLNTLGDIAAVSGADLKTLARITGEARAENKLLTRDLRQLVSNGVPIIGLLADSLGVAENKIFDMASAGEISFEVLIDAFEKATAAGGMYENGMEKLSDTMGGIWSNFLDSTDLALGKLGKTITEVLDLKGVLREVVEQIDRAAEWFNELSESEQKMLITLTAITAALGPAIFLLGSLSVAIGAISGPMAAVAAGVAVGTSAIIRNWEEIEEYFTSGGGYEMWQSIKSISSETVDIVTGIWDQYGDFLMEKTEQSFGFVLKTMEFTFGRMETMMKKFNGTMDTELNVFEDNWFTTMDKIDGKIVNMSLSFVKKFGEAFNLIPSEYDQLVKEFEDRDIEVPDFGLIVTEEELQKMRDYLAKVKEVEAFYQSASEADISLNTAKADEFAKMMKEIAERDVIIDPELLELDIPAVHGGIRIPVTIPEDEIISEMDKIEEAINGADLDLGEKIFPPGSIGSLRERVSELQDEIQYLTDPQEIRTYQNEIEGLQERIKRLTGVTNEQNESTRKLDFAFKSAFEDAVISIGKTEDALESFGNVLSGLFEDIARLLLRENFTNPLMDALGLFFNSGGTSSNLKVTGDSSIFDSWSQGGTYGATTSAATTSGSMPIMQPVKSSAAPSLSQKVNLNIFNQNGSQVETRQSKGPGGQMNIDVLVKNKVKDMFNRGEMDRVMGGNYGIRRSGVNRG
tara:strand:+ start:24956 stop:27382 length:2427 start_codon:yes stop_codon:yes gene_type:complete